MFYFWLDCDLEYNHAEPKYNHTEPEYNHMEPEYNHTEPEYNHTEPQYNDTEPVLLFKTPEGVVVGFQHILWAPNRQKY